jgi:phosphopantothenoylcysteine synthetase/decarboxylase
MNTLMYEHPLTSEHIRIVRDVVHYNVIGPIGKGLACGDVGEWPFEMDKIPVVSHNKLQD